MEWSRRNCACLLIFLSCAFPSAAQKWDWVNRFVGSGSEVRSVSLDAEENIYIAGTFSGTNQIGTNTFISAGGTDTFVAKFTSTGVPVWAIGTGGTNDDVMGRLVVTTNGTVFICGRFDVDAGLLAPGASNIISLGNVFAARIDGGKFSWLDASPPDGALYASSAALGHDETLWIIGSSNRVFVKHYSQSGAILNSMAVGESWFDPRMIAVDPQQRVFITGLFVNTVNLGGTNLSSFNYTYFTAGLDAAGSTRWAWSLRNYYPDSTALAIAPDGGVVSVGYWNTGLPQGYGVVVKHSAEDGAELWRHDHSEDFKGIFRAQAVAIDSRGTIHVVGDARMRFFSGNGSRYYALWLLSLSSGGAKLTQQFVISSYPNNNLSALGIALNREGDTVIAGYLTGRPVFGTNVMGDGPTDASNGFIARRATIHPALRIHRSGDGVTLDWPRTALPFALQQNSDLSTSNWLNVAILPTETNGRRSVSVPTSGAQSYSLLLMTNEVPIRHVPVIYGPSLNAIYFLGRNAVITPSNTISGLQFTATAEDADEETLTYTWFNPDTGTRYTNGITVTPVRHSIYNNLFYFVGWRDESTAFPLGTNRIAFSASDGIFTSDTSTNTFTVITVTAAITEMIAAVETLTTGDERARLTAPLQQAHTVATGGDFTTAAQQLEEFRARLSTSADLDEIQKSGLSESARAVVYAISGG